MRRRRFPGRDLAGFDQIQAEAMEEIRNADSFMLFTFDSVQRMSQLTHAIAVADIPHAISALHAAAKNLIDQATPEQIQIVVLDIRDQLEEEMGL